MTLSEFTHELVKRRRTMTHHDDAGTSADVLAGFGDDDIKEPFRRLLEHALQEMIDADVPTTSAPVHERTGSRSNYRNGTRERASSKPAGGANYASRPIP